MDADLAAELPPDRSGQEAVLTPLLAALVAANGPYPPGLIWSQIELDHGPVKLRTRLPGDRCVLEFGASAWPKVVAQYRRPNRQRPQPKEIVLTLPEGLVTLRQMEGE